MRQGCAAQRPVHVRVVRPAAVAGDAAARAWPAWASLLLVLGSGAASWAAILLTASSADRLRRAPLSSGMTPAATATFPNCC